MISSCRILAIVSTMQTCTNYAMWINIVCSISMFVHCGCSEVIRPLSPDTNSVTLKVPNDINCMHLQKFTRVSQNP